MVFGKTNTSTTQQLYETEVFQILTGLRKNHNMQYTLLRMIKNWKTQLNNKKAFLSWTSLKHLTP